MKRLWIAVLLSACAGCAPARIDTTDVVLSYAERPGHCENCAEFEVRFRAGGLVTFIGRRACPVPGPLAFRIPATEFDELVRSFYALNFFAIPRKPGPLLVDGGVVTVTYRDSRRVHETVRSAQPPDALVQLETRLRRASRADELLRPSLEQYRKLVADGWDVNTLDDSHDNALVATITAGDLESTQFLLSRGARLSDAAARIAARRPEMGFIRMLIEAFGSATPRRSLGPLLLEAAGTSVTNTRVLLDAGADVDWRSSRAAPTALMNAISAGALDTAALLLQRGANPDGRDNEGRTAMSYAAAAYNTGFIGMLAQRGADVNARDRSGRTPLMIASDRCHEWNIAPLLAAGADPSLADSTGRTALRPVTSVVGDPKCARTLRLVEDAVRRRTIAVR